MASDTRTLIEDVIRRWDPTLDLRPSGSVQTEVIDPLVESMGTDPLGEDLAQFIMDRLGQEHSDLLPVAGDAIYDTLISPMITILEPFRREVNRVLLNQTVSSPSLSDEDADALVANLFTSPRQGGDRSRGVVRLYFVNPSRVVVSSGTTFSSKGGLTFTPESPVGIDADRMAAQKEEGLYWLEVSVVAEKTGSEYNVFAEDIVRVNGVPNVIRVTNKVAFSGGDKAETNTELLGRAEVSLAERSLNTARGIVARLSDAFPNRFRFIEVVRHGDSEMKRDLVKGSSGVVLAHTGLGLPINNKFVVSVDQAHGAVTPGVGDQITLFYPPSMYANADLVNAGLNQVTGRMQSFTVSNVESGVEFSDNKNVDVYTLSGTPPLVNPSLVAALAGDGVSPVVYWIESAAPITISDIPGGILQPDAEITIKQDEVHVGGHVDVYVKPTRVSQSSVNLASAKGESPLVADIDLMRVTQVGKVNSASARFKTDGVRAGDLLDIETGDYRGVYPIMDVIDENNLLVDGDFAVNFVGARFRVIRTMAVDLVEPKHIKVPFGRIGGRDLDTVAGSATFDTGLDDLRGLGAVVGDTIRLLGGEDKGDYTIRAWSADDGTKPLVDRRTTRTNAGLDYEVFSATAGITRPLVRVRDVRLLDSQGANPSDRVPYGLPILIRTVCCVTGASVTDQGDLLAVVPKLLLADFPNNTVYEVTDLDKNAGMTSVANGGNLPNYAFGGNDTTRTACFVAFSPMAVDTAMFVIGDIDQKPAGGYVGAHDDPELAAAQVGDVLEVKDGPNKGSYTIKSVDKVRFTSMAAGGGDPAVTGSVVFVQAEETIPETSLPYTERILTQFKNGADTAYDRLATMLSDERAALEALGYDFGGNNPTPDNVLAIWAEDHASYHYGTRGRGKIRLYFMDPLWFTLQAGTGTDASTFVTEEGLQFRLPFDSTVQVYPDRSVVGAENYPRELLIDPNDDGGALALDDVLLGHWTLASGATATADAWRIGARAGDVLEVHEERTLNPNNHGYWDAVVVQTSAGSSQITLMSDQNTGKNHTFGLAKIGDIVVLENGADAGTYKVVERVDDDNLKLNKLLVASRSELAPGGMGSRPILPPAAIPNDSGKMVVDAGKNKFYRQDDQTDPSFADEFVGKYLQLYNQPAFINSVFKIVDNQAGANPTWIEVSDPDGLWNNGSGNFSWLITDHKDGMSNVRIYSRSASKHVIETIGAQGPFPAAGVAGAELENVTTSYLHLATPLQSPPSFKPPFRITRAGKTVSPKDMKEVTESGVHYVELDVISDGVSEAYNIDNDVILQEKDNWVSEGYTITSKNVATTFSEGEDVELYLPVRVLPEALDDEQSNRVSVSGRGVQVTYEHAPMLVTAQSLFSSPLERVAVANSLVKHPIPAYLYLDIQYSGGQSVSVMVRELRDMLDATRATDRLEVSDVEAVLHRSGATFIDQDIALLVVYHALDRRRMGARTTNFFPASTNPPFVEGSSRLISYVSGPNRANETDPVGERTTLRRI